MLNGEKLENFLLRLETKQGFFLSLLFVNIILEVLANTLRKEKEITGIQVREKKQNCLFLANIMVFYVENLKELIKQPLELISDQSKLMDRSLMYKSKCFPINN